MLDHNFREPVGIGAMIDALLRRDPSHESESDNGSCAAWLAYINCPCVRVLVIDDDVDHALGLAGILDAEGHDVRVLHDAAQAFEVHESFGPEIVLLELPRDGSASVLEFLEFRGAPGFLPPIIVVSSRTDEVSRVRAFRAGATDYVTKPVAVLELMERIRVRVTAYRQQSRAF